MIQFLQRILKSIQTGPCMYLWMYASHLSIGRNTYQGAINIPYESIVFPMSGLDRRKTYVLYCDRGATSLLAARKLHEAGYNVLSIIGGLGAYQGPLAR